MEINWGKINKPYYADKSEAKNENYLFIKQMDDFNKIIESNNNDISGMVVSVIGDRGTGKSSFLGTIKNVISEEYCVIGLIDPSSFDGSLNLLEVMFSKIYHRIVEENNHIEKYDESCRLELISKVKDASSTLNNIRIEKNDFVESNLTEEILENYSNRIRFDELVGEVIELYLKFENAISSKNGKSIKKLAIIIDDLDMAQSNEVYKMLEDIRKYLKPYALVILAYRGIQLQNVVTQEMVEKNKNLLNKKMISKKEIKYQMAKYIEKTVPASNCIFLPSGEEIYHSTLIKIVDNILNQNLNKNDKEELFYNEFIKKYHLESYCSRSDLKIELRNWFYLVWRESIRLDLSPIDSKEESNLQFPNNLRGALDLVKNICLKMRIVQEKDEYIKDKSVRIKDKSEMIKDNIETYKLQFLDRCKIVLSDKMNEIINEWEYSTVEKKNYNVYYNLWKTFLENEKDKNSQNKLLDIYMVQQENIAIADVYILFEELKVLKIENIEIFIYAMKVLYSLELEKLYLRAVIEKSKSLDDSKIKNEYEIRIEEYLKLLNAYCIPKYILDDISNQYKNQNYSWKFEYDDAKYDKDKNYKEIIDNMCYMNVSSESSITQVARKMIGNNLSKDSQRMYKYRNVFKYGKLELTKGRKYDYDLFGFMGREEYIKNSIDYLFNDVEDEFFVLRSMFDIDRFLIANYIRRSEKNLINYAIRSINDLLANEKEDKRFSFKTKLIHNCNETEVKFRTVYSKEFSDVRKDENTGEIIQKVDFKEFDLFEDGSEVEKLHKLKERGEDEYIPRQDVLKAIERMLNNNDISNDIKNRLISIKAKGKFSKEDKQYVMDMIKEYSGE